MNTRQATYVDGTATLFTSLERLQNVCPFFGAYWPTQRHELMPICNNWSRNRIVTEMIWNSKHKKWGAIMKHHKIPTSDMIDTIVEGLFQQLSTAFVATAGKRHWSNTSRGDQASRHNSTLSSNLAPCLSFSWDVITIRRNQSSFTDGYEIPRIFNCPEHSQKQNEILLQTWCTTHGRSFFKTVYVITRCCTSHLKLTSGTTRNISKSFVRTSSSLHGRIIYWNTKASWCHLHV